MVENSSLVHPTPSFYAIFALNRFNCSIDACAVTVRHPVCTGEAAQGFVTQVHSTPHTYRICTNICHVKCKTVWLVTVHV